LVYDARSIGDGKDGALGRSLGDGFGRLPVGFKPQAQLVAANEIQGELNAILILDELVFALFAGLWAGGIVPPEKLTDGVLHGSSYVISGSVSQS
jgi:hypothetical protein